MQAQLYRANSTPTVDAGPKAAAATDRQLPPSTSAATATAPVGKIPNAVRSRTGSRGCSVGAGDLSGLPDRDGAGEDDNQDAGDPAAVVWQNCPRRHSPPYLAPLRPSLTPLAAGTTWPGHRASPGLGHHYHYWRILTGGKSAAR
jgi:hypothetical protein